MRRHRPSPCLTRTPRGPSPPAVLPPRVRCARGRSPPPRVPCPPCASPDLQHADGQQRREDPENPEANDHLRPAPALNLEMVVQRRAQKPPVCLGILHAVSSPPILEHIALEDHRHHLRG